jgi:hypothetical protein
MIFNGKENGKTVFCLYVCTQIYALTNESGLRFTHYLENKLKYFVLILLIIRMSIVISQIDPCVPTKGKTAGIGHLNRPHRTNILFNRLLYRHGQIPWVGN